MLALIYFIILAILAVGSALCVLLSRHPLYMSGGMARKRTSTTRTARGRTVSTMPTGTTT